MENFLLVFTPETKGLAQTQAAAFNLTTSGAAHTLALPFSPTDMPQLIRCHFPNRLSGWLVCFGLLALACAPGAEWDDEVKAAWEKAMEKPHAKIEEHFEKEVKQLVKSVLDKHALTGKQSAVLEAAAPEVIRNAARQWGEGLRAALQDEFKGGRKEMLESIRSRDMSENLQHFSGRFDQRPEMQAEWAAALRQVLPPEAFTAWERDKAQRLEERRSQIQEIIQAGIEGNPPGEQLGQSLAPILNDLRFDELKKPVRARMEKTIASWKQDFTATCETMTRRMLDIANAEFFASYWQAHQQRGGGLLHMPNLHDWLESRLPKLLEMAPSEARAFYVAQCQARDERARLAVRQTQVMIIELLVPLVDAQRAAVEALAAELPESGESSLLKSYQLEPWKVWQEEPVSGKLAAILDDAQERLWTQGVKHLTESNTRARNPEPVGKPPERHPGLGPADPVEVEAAISTYLAEDSARKAQQGLQPLLRRADEAGRVTGLDDAARAALELAARGTMQAREDENRRNQSRYLRSQVQGATAQNIRQRLAVLSSYYSSSGNDQKSLFDEQLDALLNEDQKKVLADYQQAVLQRRHEAHVSLLLARLDQEMRFSAEQHDALGKLLLDIMKKYGEDMDMVFANWGQRTPWFLQSYYLVLPGAGIEEKDFKRILNERQTQPWEQQVRQQGGHYWDQVLEYHEERQQDGDNNNRRRIIIE